jgi:hypothetical protein
MENKSVFTRILAFIGCGLVWLPILAPFIFAFIWLFRRGKFMVDFLMPAEVFPVALVGAGLLLWAAWRARSQKKLIGWSLVSAIVLLGGSQGLAVVTGMASGQTEPSGWLMAIVLGAIILFDLALVAVGLGGILLLRDLLKRSKEG